MLYASSAATSVTPGGGAHPSGHRGSASEKAPVLLEFSRRFLEWLDKVRLEDKTKTYYRDGW